MLLTPSNLEQSEGKDIVWLSLDFRGPESKYKHYWCLHMQPLRIQTFLILLFLDLANTYGPYSPWPGQAFGMKEFRRRDNPDQKVRTKLFCVDLCIEIQGFDNLFHFTPSWLLEYILMNDKWSISNILNHQLLSIPMACVGLFMGKLDNEYDNMNSSFFSVYTFHGGLWRWWNEDNSVGAHIQLWCNRVYQGECIWAGMSLLWHLFGFLQRLEAVFTDGHI